MPEPQQHLRTVDFSLLEEDALYIIDLFEKVAAGNDVDADQKRMAHIHNALSTQYKRGW